MPFTLASSGRIAMTADHLPKIIQPADNLLAVFGYSGRGIGPGTVFGSAAAEALLAGNLDGLPSMPLSQYAESLTDLKGRFFESAALASHLVSNRF